MNKTVEKGKTLIVDGPASVTVVSGKAEVFGALLKEKSKIVIREGKRLPFAIDETANFNLSLGADASVEEVENNTIPHSWIAAYERLLEIQKKPITVMVVGGVNSGKTSFCTYLANRLIIQKRKIAILDEDLGQSDIGPPSTVGYAYVAAPVTDLFNLKPENAFFVGNTSPSDAQDRTIEGVALLKNEILSNEDVDYMIVNTDGWADGEEAIIFKAHLAFALAPSVIFCLQGDDVPSLCSALGDALAEFKQERAESPTAVMERSKEVRRNLRELGFTKYLENARMKVYPLSHLRIEGKESISSIWQRTAENFLIGLYNGNKNFLGIGVLREVDYTRKALRVFTSVTEKPAYVFFGKVRLDENLREIPEKSSAAKLNA